MNKSTPQKEICEPILKLIGKTDQKILAIWAANCAKKMLPYFEKSYPKDKRPREAIEATINWVKGKINIREARRFALASHAAARIAKTENNLQACNAARAAGHAVATAHVPRHAFGPIFYTMKIINNTDKFSETNTLKSKRLLEKEYNNLSNCLNLKNKFS